MTKTRPKIATKSITESSGNVFADLGLTNPKQELTKAELTIQLYRIIKQRGMTQAEAGKALGIKQPHVSLLMRNRAGSFSVGRLMEFLTAIGQDVEISVRPSRKEHARCPSRCGEGNKWRQLPFAPVVCTSTTWRLFTHADSGRWRVYRS
jgi:predicted XRE-type DNA-binding protein